MRLSAYYNAECGGSSPVYPDDAMQVAHSPIFMSTLCTRVPTILLYIPSA